MTAATWVLLAVSVALGLGWSVDGLRRKRTK